MASKDVKIGGVSDVVGGTTTTTVTSSTGGEKVVEEKVSVAYPAGSVFTGHCDRCGISIQSYEIRDDGKICEKCDYK